MFFNRIIELNDLNNIWKADKAQLIVLYGRRRVGKSALTKFWGKDKPFFYWTATQTTSDRLLQSFSKEFLHFKTPDIETPPDFSYPNWESAFTDIASHASQNKFVMVIDELPYLIEADTEIPSLLQKMWDNGFEKSKIILILTGSRIGMIEKHILSSHGPLYGRAQAIIWLDPLPISEIHNFLPKYSSPQLVEVYSITGGVPLYVKIFDDSTSVFGNLQRELTSTTSILKGEPYFLIHEELKEPMRFIAILEAIGSGKKQLSQIAAATGIEGAHLAPYLKTLEGLRYIKRMVPITENRAKSRKGLYDFSDLFLKFYFRFIAPNQNLLEDGREESLLKIIENNFDAFVGKGCFETLCLNLLITRANKMELPFEPETFGKYWDQDIEVDVAALSKKKKAIIIGEAKYTNDKCGLGVLDELNHKAEHLNKKFGYHINKFIFAKSGFSNDLKERSRIENVNLVDLGDMFGEKI